jgi:6-phosphogluconolactonase
LRNPSKPKWTCIPGKRITLVPNYELSTYGNADDLVSAAARAWLNEVDSVSRGGKPYCVAVSGGRIALKFFAAAAAEATARKATLEGVHFFWADERCVPPDDPESNFKLADEALFRPLKVPAAQIHRIRGEDPPETAAKFAEAELVAVAPKNAEYQPVLDLVILGMGEDGHTASLFPTSPAGVWEITSPFFVVENSPKPPPTRISMSFKTIVAARNVWALISGTGKAQALQESLAPFGLTPFGRIVRVRPVRIFSDINQF